MGQIDLLWELQKNDTELTELKKEFSILTERKDIEELEVRIKEKEYDLTNKKTQLEVDNVKIQRYDQKIKQLNFEIQEIEKKLYGGSITNIKQLEKLEKEEKRLKEEIKRIENGILGLMEETDNLRTAINRVNEEYNELTDRLREANTKYEIDEKTIKEKIAEKEHFMNDIIKRIDKELVDKFNYLKQSKKKAVVKVIGDKCTGCYMAIPTSILSKLKVTDRIMYCDNCGRILFFDKNGTID